MGTTGHRKLEDTTRAAHEPPSERRQRRPDALHDDARDERLRSLRDALRAARQGDLSIRLPDAAADSTLLGEVAVAFNALIARTEGLVHELDRMSHVAGLDGEIRERASIGPASGSWSAAVASLNSLVDSMAHPTIEAT